MYVCGGGGGRWLGAGNARRGDARLASPLEEYQGSAANGYQVSYRRVPLSRERMPKAADLDVLHHQLMTQPVSMCATVHLVLSSCRTLKGYVARKITFDGQKQLLL